MLYRLLVSEARANVPTVFLHMPIGTNSLSVPIVDSIWEALSFPKIQRKQNWTHHCVLQSLLVHGVFTLAKPVTTMTDVSSSRIAGMNLQALFAYTTYASRPVR